MHEYDVQSPSNIRYSTQSLLCSFEFKFLSSFSLFLSHFHSAHFLYISNFKQLYISESIQLFLFYHQKVDPNIDTSNFLDGGLTLERAELMVENCIGKISIPLGLGLNFKLNGKYFTIPMATEEPSVIAAASSAAKFIDENGGGFTTYSTRPIMIGQIQILGVDPLSVQYKIDQNKDKIIAYANEICQNMVNRGGGVTDLKVRLLENRERNLRSTGEYEADSMVALDLFVNVCDSMGANIVNTIVEYVSPFIQSITGGRVGLKILSNLCTERRAMAEFEIPISKMGWKDSSGEIVALRMIEGYRFAQLDPLRACTHNKGIFNGMDAVAIATGQDWRSIESSCHTYASVKNRRAGYQPLNHYEVIKSLRESTKGELVLRGSIEIPISVGSQGGVLNSNSLYQNNMRLLGYPNAQQLSEIIAAVGLCQNFAALRALAVEGIQKGHMNLHARNIAISGGVPTHLVEEATRFMRSRGKMNVDTAKLYLQALNLFEQVRQDEGNATKQQRNETIKQPLSTFYVELDCEELEEPIVLHVALDCLIGEDQQPIHLVIEQLPANKKIEQPTQNIQELLFGPKGYQWLRQIFSALDVVNLNFQKSSVNRNDIPNQVSNNLHGLSQFVPTRKLAYKLKLIAIIIDLLAGNLIALDSERSIPVIQSIVEQFHSHSLRKRNTNKSNNVTNSQVLPLSSKEIALRFGLSLLSECIRVFEYNIDSARIADDTLKLALLEELHLVLESQMQSHLQWKNSLNTNIYTPLIFLQYRQKRLCATLMLLCDCVNMNVTPVNQTTLHIVKRLGSLYEIEITFSRDLHRWKHSLSELNLYTYWLLSKNQFDNGHVLTNRNTFIQEHMHILQQAKKELYPFLDDKLRTLSNITSEVIRTYYDFNQFIQPSL